MVLNFSVCKPICFISVMQFYSFQFWIKFCTQLLNHRAVNFCYSSSSSENDGLDVEILDTDELSKADKFNRSDRDPEEFACLLQKTAAIKDGQIFITCKNVLGPKMKSTGRDAVLSLLSYSFNLDPTMRMEVLITNFINGICYNFRLEN